MWRSGSFRLSPALLAALLALAGAGGDALAGQKQKQKPPARVGAKLSERALGELMGPYKFGMTKQDVLRSLSAQINDRYKEKIAGTTDVYVQDKLRRDRQVELDRIKSSYIEFKGNKTGWDVSIIDDQFAHNTDESMMVHWENSPDRGQDQRRFFFFHDGHLYKMFVALNSAPLKDEQRSFSYFQNLMEQRYGAGKVQADKGVIEWQSATYRVLAVDKLNFYGSFCLVISDPREDQELVAIRSARKIEKPENRVIDSVTSKDAKEDTPGLEDNKDAVEGVVGGK
jgi:hypothetical protein